MAGRTYETGGEEDYYQNPVRRGPGVLAVFLVPTTYVYTSSIIFVVGIQLDDLLRAEG